VIARMGSEGTRDALLFASPVPERRVERTGQRLAARLSERSVKPCRPAISCHGFVCRTSAVRYRWLAESGSSHECGERRHSGCSALQHPLCLSAESRWSLSERQAGQRLAARLCSHFRLVVQCRVDPRLRLVRAVRGIRGWGNWKSYQADARDIASAVAISAVQIIGRSNLGLWILFCWCGSVVRVRMASR
jgi:hypothetical protein